MEGHPVFAHSKVGVAPSDGNGSITFIEANFKIENILDDDKKLIT